MDLTNFASKQIILSVLGVALIVIAFFGVSYAIQTFTFDASKTNNIFASSLVFKSNYSKDYISIDNSTFFDILSGENINNKQNNNYFDISFNTDVDKTINYELSVEKDSVFSTLDDTDVRMYLEKKVDGIYKKYGDSFVFKETNNDLNPNTSMVIYNGSLDSNNSDKFRLVLWNVNDNQNVLKYYKVSLAVYGKVQ